MLTRPTLDLTGPWLFKLDAEDVGEREAYFSADRNLDDWREATVPCTFADCAPEIDRYEGIGWFRRVVRVPEEWRGKRVVLRFGGVNNRSRVWVNGQLAAEEPDAYLSFEVPVQHLLRFGDDNVIAVRVDNTRRRDTIPGAGVIIGWHPFGGIAREADLIATDPFHIADAWVTAEPTGAGGNLGLDVHLANDRREAAEGQLDVEVTDTAGKSCAHLTSQKVAVEVGETRPVRLSGMLPDAQPWSPDHPVLYTATIALRSQGRLVDSCAVRSGFRRVEAKQDALLLNGEPVLLTGFNRHEDTPARRMCVDPETARADLLAMRGMGASFLRLCHYPQHPSTLDLCDELGLLAMCEIPLYQWYGPPDRREDCPKVVEAARRQLGKMIRRYRNHPSVVFWSVSNETCTQHPEVAEANRDLMRLAKDLDPSRLAVHVSDHWQPYHDCQDDFTVDDVVCVNGYPDPDAGAHWWAEQLERLHDAYPGKPILVTEFGGAYKEGEECQARCVEAGFEGITAPYTCGMLIWCWADHPWPTELEDISLHGLSSFGVLTRERQPRKAAEVARRGFAAARERFAARSRPGPTARS